MKKKKNHLHHNHEPHHDHHGHHHPSHHRHHYGLGQLLVQHGNLTHSLHHLFNSHTDLGWVERVATADGPPHKQVRNGLLLGQLAGILKKLNLKGFSPATIPVMGTSPKEYGFQYPVGMPKELLEMIEPTNHDEVMAWVGDGPVHEVAMDLTMMIALAAISHALGKHIDNHPKMNDHENHPK